MSSIVYVREKKKLKVNAGKSKVMVFERWEEEVVDFNMEESEGDLQSSK